jgi:hypothetical protein
MNKMQLEILSKLPKQQFDVEIKLLNSKVTDEDLKPMFPEDWDHGVHWIDFSQDKQTNAEFWDKWQHTQIQIDLALESSMGC